MDLAVFILLEITYAIAGLVLISLGLAVVFGMMRVINLAHGEFLMLGGYAAIVSTQAGLNIWLAMLIVAPLTVGLVGLIVERLIIRFLYGRMLDTMLATWGLSLCLIGLVTLIFGNTTTGISTPIPALQIGQFQVVGYNLFIIVVAAVMLAGIYALLRFTDWGLIARAAMQNADMADALGINPSRVYMLTFTFGAALTGLAGGVLAPLTGIVPSIGATYIAKAFITVISGGAAIATGTLSAALSFGLVERITTLLSSPVLGEVALLIAAVLLLRFLPRGITGRFFRGRL
ncbi:MAG: branched-chain amino acid ABC transporter permease [Candidatus Competibacteraceae bacterium]|nr:branched-chain amino acid ABC transporter permease [Candidatus Competibacteraceae bacterium]MCB1815479.1 branched-chain amino acid ABC transporter permease [Candidatus Competibacteraceae bacterium]